MRLISQNTKSQNVEIMVQKARHENLHMRSISVESRAATTTSPN